MAGPILDVHGLHKGFDVSRSLTGLLRRRPITRITAVSDASFAMARHQVVGLVGESGSGKSTLAKCLVRLLEPDAGEVRLEDVDMLAAKGDELRRLRRNMQMIFQDPYSTLNPLMSVGRAVSEPAVVHGLVSSSDSADRARELLATVGLSESHIGRRPRELSGGQRQRVAIARDEH